MTDSATVHSIQVGKPNVVEAKDHHKEWTTGFQKQTVNGPVRLDRLNLAGDGQADLKHHGGPDKALCVYPIAHYPLWRAELGLDLVPGSFGENLTVCGITEDDVCIGDIWIIGDTKVQVSQPRQPCWKLSRWWSVEDLAVRVQQTGRTGWYLRVLSEGDLEAGDSIQLVERVNPLWTITAANRLMHSEKDNIVGAKILASLPELSASWTETLTRRSRNQQESSPAARLYGAERSRDR
ncbi:MOSC domain-containing protein [Thalassoglobus sp.]|uniref:MOSC domain-containing protein n=1 Tax=Thalassoglobus sp. TaxID=2795869 RepID=UPI003AA7EFC1